MGSIINKFIWAAIIPMVIAGCSGGAGGDGSGGDTAQKAEEENVLSGMSANIERVIDGDTVVLSDGTHIRLTCIDAPESDQEFGSVSAHQLRNLIEGKNVSIVTKGKTRDGRTLGTLYVGGVDINLEQVKRGNAWVYREYCKDCRYWDAEKEARDRKVGLWIEDNPTPPWEYRKDRNSSAGVDWSYLYPLSCPYENNEPGSCGTKSTCSEMSTCDEAYFYLETCNVGTLDRDKDGVPCEALCL